MLHALLAALAIAAPQVTAKIDGFNQPCGSAVFGKYLYVDSYGSGILNRVDPTTNAIVKRSKVASAPCGVVAGAGALLVEEHPQKAVLRVNPAGKKAEKGHFFGKKAWGVAVRLGSGWGTGPQAVHGSPP